MRHIFVYMSVLLLSFVLAACDDVEVFTGGDGVRGSGTIVTETREVTGFNQITLAGEGAVILTEGQDPSLTIETDDNLMVHIQTSVTGDVLRIATESGIDIDPTDSVVYRVSAPTITGLTLSGAGSLQLSESGAEEMAVLLSGAGDIRIGSLSAAELVVEISGAGAVTIAGQTGLQTVKIPGAGSYEGAELASSSATVTTSGVGSATVWVTDQLVATVTGVGSIDYYGTPAVTQAVSGVGTINSRGDK